jgi:predicted phage terminase large subunit-like protein
MKIPADVKEMARGLTKEAINTLAAVMRDSKAPHSARVRAAETLLDRAWGRPETSTYIRVSNDVRAVRSNPAAPGRWFGEKGVIEKSVRPYLMQRMNERRAYRRIEWLPSINDKPTRCRSFQALASMGKLMLPVEAPWKAELLGQLTRFPAGKFDDGVDVCSLIGRRLRQMPAASAAMSSQRPWESRSTQHQYEYDPFAECYATISSQGRSDYDPWHSDQRPVDRSRYVDQIEMLKRRTNFGS